MTTANISPYIFTYFLGSLKVTSKSTLAEHIFQQNSAIMDYFDFYDEESDSYIPRSAVAVLYPED